jgi:hypothetical protein
MLGKKVCFIAIILLGFSLCACKYAKESSQDSKINITPEPISPPLSDTIDAVFEPEIENKIEIETPSHDKSVLTSIEEVDYSNYFDGLKGCAVFFNSQTNVYQIYQEALSNQPSSPCSTFKIISALMGLEEGVISSADSKMGYEGTIYTNETWNTDLGLKDAFNE